MASGAEDESLRRELRLLGLCPGPVTDSTRALYRRKLERLRAMIKASHGLSGTQAQSEQEEHYQPHPTTRDSGTGDGLGLRLPEEEEEEDDRYTRKSGGFFRNGRRGDSLLADTVHPGSYSYLMAGSGHNGGLGLEDGEDDENLRRELRLLGLCPGPVTDSTRALYRRKLERLRAKSKASHGLSTSNSSRTRAQSQQEEHYQPHPTTRDSGTGDGLGLRLPEEEEEDNRYTRKSSGFFKDGRHTGTPSNSGGGGQLADTVHPGSYSYLTAGSGLNGGLGVENGGGDENLRWELQRAGLCPGPITDSTRSLYRRKLERLRTEGKRKARRRGKPGEEESQEKAERLHLGLQQDTGRAGPGPTGGLLSASPHDSVTGDRLRLPAEEEDDRYTRKSGGFYGGGGHTRTGSSSSGGGGGLLMDTVLIGGSGHTGGLGGEDRGGRAVYACAGSISKMASAANDENLRRELQRLGSSPGPITDSTRSLYERKLGQLRSEEKRKASLEVRKRLSGSTSASSRTQAWPAQSQQEDNYQLLYTTRDSGTGDRRRRWLQEEEEKDDRYSRKSGSLFGDGRYTGTYSSGGGLLADTVHQGSCSYPMTGSGHGRTFSTGYAGTGGSPEDYYKRKYGTLFAGDGHTGKTSSPFARGSSALTGYGRLSAPGDEPDDARRRLQQGKSRRDQFELCLSRFLYISTLILALVLLGLVCVKTSGFAEGYQEDTRGNIKMLPMECHDKTDPFCQSEENKDLMNLLSEMYDYLAERAGEIECGDHSPLKQKCILVTDVKRHLTIIDSNISKFDVALQWIIQSKLDVGIRLVGDISETVTSLDLVTCLESTRPRMTVFCRLKFALFTILNRMLIFFLVLGVLWILLLFLKYGSSKLKEQQGAVYKMVNKIIGVIHAHNRDWEKNLELMPYIPIPHVRDTLIPPEDRTRMKKVWQKAVKFLETNESRIRTEGQRINGEDFLVWRWTQPSSYCDSMT